MSHTLPEACPNCGAQVHGPYCAQCGQDTVIEAPTLHEFVHEYLHHYVALEGKLWRTLKMLMLRPGELTNEFLVGRRQRYVKPLALYITFSFLFFLINAWVPASKVETAPAAAQPITTLETGDANADKEVEEVSSKIELDAGAPDWLQRAATSFNAAIERYRADPEATTKRFAKAFQAKLPYAIFLLMPVFALSSWVLYRRRRRYYGEHVLMALHFHAFVFLSLLVFWWLPYIDTFSVLIPVWLIYLTIALRRVLGGRRWPQFLRAGLLLLAHGFWLGIASLALLLLAAVEALSLG